MNGPENVNCAVKSSKPESFGKKPFITLNLNDGRTFMIRHSHIDKVAGISSLICGIHCMLMPFLLTLLPFGFIAWFADETFEMIFISLSAITALCSICYGFTKHGNKNLIFLTSLGLLTIAIARHYHESVIGACLMALGGFQLCVAHFANLRLCNSCSRC